MHYNDLDFSIRRVWKQAAHSSWQKLFPEIPCADSIEKFLKEQTAKGTIIFPSAQNIFRAFCLTNIDTLKAVVLGQDPYHQPGQADGLAFSVPQGQKTPPSLRNIFKEIARSEGQLPSSTDLTHWASQGVLLLNTSLTVNRNEPASHAKAGWEAFTTEVIRVLSQKRSHLVFLLWGSFAEKFEKKIALGREHLILKTSHPSPLSVYRGFEGCGHFQKVNHWLKERGGEPIKWCQAPFSSRPAARSGD